MRKSHRNVPYPMGERNHDSEEAYRLWRYPKEYRTAHPFEATPGNSDILSHPEHIHMQIDGNEAVALEWAHPDVCRYHEKYAKVGQ